MKLKNKIITYLVIPILIFSAWIVIYWLGVFNRLMFPNPFEIILEFINMFSNKEIISNLLRTLVRVIDAIIIGAFIGIPFGLFFGYFKKIYLMFEFIIDFFRSIPVTALFPLFMLFFGIGDLSKIILASWMTGLIILVNTAYGVRHSNKAYLKMARIYNVKKSYLLPNIVFYGALPHIFSGLRIGTSISLIIIIVTEMFIGSVNGLGYAILNAQLMYEIPKMYAIIILTGVLGFLLNKFLLIIEKRVIHWTKKN